MEVLTGTRASESRLVLCVHTAVSYGRIEGLGIGLVQRVACARTGRTDNAVLQTAERGLKVTCEEFAATERNPRDRADLLALLKALHMAAHTVKVRWPAPVKPTVVVILLGRPCKELLAMIKHHIEHGPSSFKSITGNNRSTVSKIVSKIHYIRSFGFKVSIAMSDHHHTKIQQMAARKAEQRFRRVCRDQHK